MPYTLKEVRARLRDLVRDEMMEAYCAKGCHSPAHAEAARARNVALGKLVDRLLYEMPKHRLMQLAATHKIKALDEAAYEAMEEDDYP